MPPVARFMGAALAALAAYGTLSMVRIAPASAAAMLVDPRVFAGLLGCL